MRRFLRIDPLLLAVIATVLVGSAGAHAPTPEVARLRLRLQSPRASLSFTEVANDELPPLSIPKLVADGRHWRLDTARGGVHVWLPHGYAAATAITVVFVHGYRTDVDGAWFGHRLPEQFALAGINAMFIACEAPSWNNKPIAWPSLRALLDTVRTTTKAPMPKGRVVALGHSGAFRTLELWLANPRLDTVVLLDAAYGDLWAYRRWLLRSAKNRLINVADDTVARTEILHRSLPSTVVLDGFPVLGIPEDARAARILYIRSELGHMPLVTAGVALPTILRALRAKRVLTAPIPYPY